jgi:hypothetical protein
MAYTTIDKGSKYFDTSLWSGNDGTQSITTLNFKPDFLWLKSRNTAVGHQLIDVIRGTGKQLNSNDTASEASPTYPYVSTFDTNGWTMTNGSLSGGNTSGRTYVGWSWLGTNTTASNNSGTITSTVSANTTSGFSIVSYTGNGSNAQTVGHGLGAVPKFIIVKPRNYADHWSVYHSSLGATKYLYLDGTDSVFTGASRWSDTTPTSTVFTIGTSSPATGGGYTYNYIAYCFAEIKGYSKFGSWVGNGSTDGTFVYTGFKPSFVMFKSSSNTSSWGIVDNKRDSYNLGGIALVANASDAEYTPASSGYAMDFLSNGIKLRGGTSQPNTSGQTNIYMAFAENPFVSSKGIACTAR